MIQEIIQKEAEKARIYPEKGVTGSYNNLMLYEVNDERENAFTSGANFMLEHMGKFAEWASVNGWRFNAFRNNWEKQVYATGSPFITTQQLIEKYFESLTENNL